MVRYLFDLLWMLLKIEPFTTDVKSGIRKLREVKSNINAARLNFVACDTCTDFAITDRNAIDDGNATIQVPASMLAESTRGILFDVYIRVMGKPLQCMEIEGYAYDGSYYYNSGSVYLSKKAKTTFVKINDLFDVYYCDPGATTCDNEISVFADVFDSYFWELYNDGTKVVQVRIYAQAL
jgi:hypothetical protein